jgi:hypothetical protein
MRAEAGDELLIEADGDHITLRPTRQEALLKRSYPRNFFSAGGSGGLISRIFPWAAS